MRTGTVPVLEDHQATPSTRPTPSEHVRENLRAHGTLLAQIRDAAAEANPIRVTSLAEELKRLRSELFAVSEHPATPRPDREAIEVVLHGPDLARYFQRSRVAGTTEGGA